MKEDKIVILDRDGVINVDLMTYVTSPEEFEAIEGSLEAIGELTANGYKVAIATNQACIEKEIITWTSLKGFMTICLYCLENLEGK